MSVAANLNGTFKKRRAAGVLAAASLAVGSIGLITSAAKAGSVGDVFVIDMENHNLVQPVPGSSPEQIQGNAAAPYLNSLMTPGNTNAAQASWASSYHNVASGVHPSEPNYVWQEGGSNYGELTDNDPYNFSAGTNVFNAQNLTGLLQNAGISWKTYAEDTDLTATTGSVNQNGYAPGNTIAPQNQWTVPLHSFSGTSTGYTNAYNGSNQFNYAPKHVGQVFYTDTNGGTVSTPNNSSSNPESLNYAPLQQLTADLNNNTVARYNQITPDQFNDAHSALTGGFTYQGTHYTGDQAAVAQGDNFLSQIVPQIEASQAYKNNGAIVIWWDETEGGDTSAFTLPEIVISPLAVGDGFQSTLNYTHSSDLLTLQEIFQVAGNTSSGALGDAGTPGTNDLSALFQAGMIPTSVPEPTSIGMIAVGGLALLKRRRRLA